MAESINIPIKNDPGIAPQDIASAFHFSVNSGDKAHGRPQVDLISGGTNTKN